MAERKPMCLQDRRGVNSVANIKWVSLKKLAHFSSALNGRNIGQ